MRGTTSANVAAWGNSSPYMVDNGKGRRGHLRLVGAGEPPPLKRDVLGAALAVEWATWMRAQGIGERTIVDRMQLLDRVVRRTGQNALTFDPGSLASFLAGPMGAGTRQTYYSALRGWSVWLLRAGHRQDDPTALLMRPRVPRRQPRPITNEHLEKLLTTRMHRRTRTMILLAAYQGLRVHEIAGVRGEHVDLLGHRLQVIGKGGLDVVLPLHPLIEAEAADYPDRGWWFPSHVGNVAGRDGGGPILPRSVTDIVRYAMRRAGVPGSAHSIRHWHGTQLLRNGGDTRVTQTLLRHASLATTALYTQVDEVQQRAALLRLPVFGEDVPP